MEQEQKNLSLMTRIRGRWNRLLTDRKGQSTTEYILILAIVVMIASKVKTTLTNKVLDEGLNKLDFSKVMDQNQ